MTDPSLSPPHEVKLGGATARWLVAYSSGAVLMLEIVSLRLVAPYVGLTLETSTAVIGFALAAISVGAIVGGRVADRRSPGRLLGPVFLSSGVLMLLVAPVVRWTGNRVGGGEVVGVLVVTAIAVFPPSALLSSVTPMVAKMQLRALAETGRVIGSLSGVATLGALVATFITGFVLVAAVPTMVILGVLGGSLILTGLVLIFRRKASLSAAAFVAVIGTAAVVAAAPSPGCDVETAYHCARIVHDPQRPSGRTLQLDTLSHSYVDLEDPTHLEFTYVRGIAAVVDALLPADDLRALHLGGGGLSIPRYLAATRPGGHNLVFEIDSGVVELDTQRLGARMDQALEVRVRDARVGLAAEPSGSRDLVVGDAFAGLSVPWHLTTREAVEQAQRVLDPDGLYIVNLIDYPPLGFVRAEVATIREVFPHVAVIARSAILERREGGNVLVVGSDRPLLSSDLSAALQERVPELDLAAGDEVDRFVGDAQVLTDDFAPVDQLLTPYPRP